MSWLPNAITLLRMALAAPLAWAILADRHELALLLALIAGLSDGIDGWLAKRFGWQSWLGGILDPLADKLMLTACFVALTVVDAVPAWLLALVVGRDVLIVAGATTYHYTIGPLNAAPTLLSKLTTLVQILFVLAVLVSLTPPLAPPVLLLDTLLWAAAVVTVASGLHYVLTWSSRARDAVRLRHKP